MLWTKMTFIAALQLLLIEYRGKLSAREIVQTLVATAVHEAKSGGIQYFAVMGFVQATFMPERPRSGEG